MKISELDNSRQIMNLSNDYFYRSSSRDAIVKDRSTLKLIVDEPCLKACEYLYDCNIWTRGSTANQNDIKNGYGCITIDYDTLDENNKDIFNSLQLEGVIKHSCIILPLDSDTTIEDFSKDMLELAMMFQPQDILYGFFTEEEMLAKVIRILEDNPFFYYADEADNCYSFRFLDYIEYLIEKNEFLPSSLGEVTMDLKDGSSAVFKLTDFLKAYLDLPSGCREDIYYDEEENKYWFGKGLFDKHIDYIESVDNYSTKQSINR